MRKWINLGSRTLFSRAKPYMKTYETTGVTQNFTGKKLKVSVKSVRKKNRESETGLSNTKFIKLLVFYCLIKWLPVSQEIRWFWPWNSDSLPKVKLEFFKNLSLNLRYILHKSINLLVSEYLSWRDRKKDTGPDGWAWKHCGDKPNTIGKFNSFSRLPNENFGL